MREHKTVWDVILADPRGGHGLRLWFIEAAQSDHARIRALQAEVKRLKQALAPFADLADGLDFYVEECWPADPVVPARGKADEVYGTRTLRLASSCRSARAALAAGGEE